MLYCTVLKIIPCIRNVGQTVVKFMKNEFHFTLYMKTKNYEHFKYIVLVKCYERGMNDISGIHYNRYHRTLCLWA